MQIGTKSFGLNDFNDYCREKNVDPSTLKQLIEYNCQKTVTMSEDQITDKFLSRLHHFENFEPIFFKNNKYERIEYEISLFHLLLHLRNPEIYGNRQMMIDIGNAYKNKDLSTLLRLSEISV